MIVAVVPIRSLSSFRTLLSINVIRTFSLRWDSPDSLSTSPSRLSRVRSEEGVAPAAGSGSGAAGLAAGSAAAGSAGVATVSAPLPWADTTIGATMSAAIKIASEPPQRLLIRNC